MIICKRIVLFVLSLFLSNGLIAQGSFLLHTSINQNPMPLDVKALEKNYPWMHKKTSKLRPLAIKLKTKKRVKFSANFYDHGRDQIIILGQGFRGNKQSMDYFVKAFGASYDMITFDYRWKNLSFFCLRPQTLISPFNQLIHVEQEEVKAVIDFVKRRKTYKDVICLGLCYSSFLFLMAQADAEKNGSTLFTKMIIDSCWYSLDGFLQSICNDPMLPFQPQSGGTPAVLKSILKYSPGYRLFFHSIKKCVPGVCIKDYVSKVTKPPIFFIHGADDKLVPLDHFNRMWACTVAPKVGLLTPYQHADNFVNEALYTTLCDLFIQSDGIDEFVTKLAIS